MASITLTRAQSRELDRRAIEECAMSGLVLMENAGRGCVDVLEQLGIDGPVVILCGKGNNAGDGFVIARHLNIRGYKCQVLTLCPENELRGDAAANYAILKHTSIPIRAGDELEDHRDAAWIIDALLGTGAQGDPRPPFEAAINWINSHSANSRVLAVDVPSGLDCDTGQPSAHTVRADHTCTFGAMKVGYTHAAQALTGAVHVCDIGVPPQLLAEICSIRPRR